MKVFFYFHKFIFKNTFGILKKKNIYLTDFIKKNNSLEIKFFFCPRTHNIIEPALMPIITAPFKINLVLKVEATIILAHSFGVLFLAC